ncbi:DNA cytosine methyltransferase [Brevibacterium sp.]|uniref:DNA cytosine methyltransferase n=1 Tax=Brevibacterium sp. TaxID=1701 RepID=UPI002811E1A2|nr:DNA cytosine methyltransferase [Brevibacterium sp.]
MLTMPDSTAADVGWDLSLLDMFCGAGGSSTGALDVPGVTVRTAMNHWDKAIESHAANHPGADHVLADVSQIDPRYVPQTDILWASPECTNHSQAKGRKRALQAESLFDRPDEAAERSRATMWDVPRFAEHHKYRIIITENVVDAAMWVMWDAWLHAMDSLGYDHHVVYINSMHAQAYGLPAPQSRDRMYVVFWRKGNKAPDFDRLRPPAYCHQCDQIVSAMQVFKKEKQWGRYRTQYVWRCPASSCRNAVVEPGWLPASSIIDWSAPITPIRDRPLKEYFDKSGTSLGFHHLAPKTEARVAAGVRKFFDPFLTRHNSVREGEDPGPLSTPTTEVMRTLTTAGHQSLIVPVEGRDGKTTQTASAPMRTQTTRNESALVMAPPLIVNNVSGSDSTRSTTVHDPIPTLVAGGTHASLLVPAGGTWHENAHPTADPMRTITTTESHGLAVAPSAAILEAAGNTYDATDPRHPGHGRDDGYYRIWPDNEPLRTLHTTESKAVVIPLRNHNTAKPVTSPLDTIAANGNHHALASMESIDFRDCLFRMLSPHEIKLGMAFPADYVLLGTKRQQVKLAGNAVTPPIARDLIRIAVSSLIEEAA